MNEFGFGDGIDPKVTPHIDRLDPVNPPTRGRIVRANPGLAAARGRAQAEEQRFDNRDFRGRVRGGGPGGFLDQDTGQVYATQAELDIARNERQRAQGFSRTAFMVPGMDPHEAIRDRQMQAKMQAQMQAGQGDVAAMVQMEAQNLIAELVQKGILQAGPNMPEPEPEPEPEAPILGSYPGPGGRTILVKGIGEDAVHFFQDTGQPCLPGGAAIQVVDDKARDVVDSFQVADGPLRDQRPPEASKRQLGPKNKRQPTVSRKRGSLKAALEKDMRDGDGPRSRPDEGGAEGQAQQPDSSRQHDD